MRTATTSTAIHAIEETTRVAHPSGFSRFAGLAIASLVPAAFWSAILAVGALWLDKPLSSKTILMVGAAIALFLFAICAPLMLRRPAADTDAKIQARKA
ncbi:hypothetical protein [Hyphomicrobium sp. 802]|uniref:hypothetical protein n=1 Tax=Hyphomicrobium sp. 802 TaxID=1112272 RepID=UPI0009DDE8A1|nr:hypothetical protein [Hyphomicrobium sp. 802]